MTIKEVSRHYGISQDTLRYYERAGMIPAVPRTAGGVRQYGEEELRWVELALCMRGAGLSVAAIAEYVRLTRQGDATIPERLALLRRQRQALLARRQQIQETLNRLEYKIARYEQAAETGVLNWDN